MEKPEQLLHDMDHLLDKLIDNQKKLLELSKHVVNEEEIKPLQQDQNTLLDQLISKDKAYDQLKKGAKETPSPLRKQIDDKLDLFQQLNTTFIENITSTQGLIKFGKAKPHKK